MTQILVFPLSEFPTRTALDRHATVSKKLKSILHLELVRVGFGGRSDIQWITYGGLEAGNAMS